MSDLHTYLTDFILREVITQRDLTIKELEEKMDFNERWISQTCETGKIQAERKLESTDDTEWILSVTIEGVCNVAQHLENRLYHQCSNASERAVDEFNYDGRKYANTGDTFNLLITEKAELQAKVKELEAQIEDMCKQQMAMAEEIGTLSGTTEEH